MLMILPSGSRATPSTWRELDLHQWPGRVKGGARGSGRGGLQHCQGILSCPDFSVARSLVWLTGSPSAPGKGSVRRISSVPRDAAWSDKASPEAGRSPAETLQEKQGNCQNDTDRHIGCKVENYVTLVFYICLFIHLPIHQPTCQHPCIH